MNLPNYEAAGDLKIGQVGIANLRIRTLDIPALANEMRQRVARAPKLFARAPVIIDFGGLPRLPDAAEATRLIDALRETGVLPVGLAWGSSENDALAVKLGLPLLAKFRADYERSESAHTPPPPQQPAAAPSTTSEPGLMHTSAVRSGQQLYAEQRDLTVVGTVGAGAEVISDGSIHVYGSLRGRALAGARGMENARIFCQAFHAELVAIAGHYKVADDVPRQLHGRPVQIWLEAGELKLQLIE